MCSNLPLLTASTTAPATPSTASWPKPTVTCPSFPSSARSAANSSGSGRLSSVKPSSARAAAMTGLKSLSWPIWVTPESPVWQYNYNMMGKQCKHSTQKTSITECSDHHFLGSVGLWQHQATFGPDDRPNTYLPSYNCTSSGGRVRNADTDDKTDTDNKKTISGCL